METPTIYSQYALACRSVCARNRWKIVFASAVVLFTPAVLERAFLFGPTPGRILFVFMLLYFAAIAPLVAFSRGCLIVHGHSGSVHGLGSGLPYAQLGRASVFWLSGQACVGERFNLSLEPTCVGKSLLSANVRHL